MQGVLESCSPPDPGEGAGRVAGKAINDWEATAMVAGEGVDALVSRGDKAAASHPEVWSILTGLQVAPASSVGASSAEPWE